MTAANSYASIDRRTDDGIISLEPFRVSSQSNPNSTAGAIANVIRDDGFAELQVIGAGALNQAIKAVAIARGFLSDDGLDLVCVPTFTEVFIDGELRTAIRLAVHDRRAVVADAEVSMGVVEEEQIRD